MARPGISLGVHLSKRPSNSPSRDAIGSLTCTALPHGMVSRKEAGYQVAPISFSDIVNKRAAGLETGERVEGRSKVTNPRAYPSEQDRPGGLDCLEHPEIFISALDTNAEDSRRRACSRSQTAITNLRQCHGKAIITMARATAQALSASESGNRLLSVVEDLRGRISPWPSGMKGIRRLDIRNEYSPQSVRMGRGLSTNQRPLELRNMGLFILL